MPTTGNCASVESSTLILSESLPWSRNPSTDDEITSIGKIATNA